MIGHKAIRTLFFFSWLELSCIFQHFCDLLAQLTCACKSSDTFVLEWCLGPLDVHQHVVGLIDGLAGVVQVADELGVGFVTVVFT